MVKLSIKKADEPQFLYETTVQIPVDDLIKEIAPIYNGRLKVQRICSEMEQLADHGTTLPPNMMGLTDEQVEELKLRDEWGDKCEPSGGSVFNKDGVGRRNGKAPNPKIKEVLTKTIKEAKDIISKKKVAANELLTLTEVQQAVDILRGAVMIVYPMNLPPHDPIRLEFENQEELEGQQASLDVIEEAQAALWFAGKEIQRGKKLMDFVGKNEKSKIICKIQKRGGGAPAREAVVSEEDQKSMMAYAYKKQEEFKKLHQAAEDDSSDYSSGWADNKSLSRQMQGLNNVKWGAGKL